MPAIPASTKTSLAQRLRQHARDHWPQLAGLRVRYHGQFAYIEGELADGDRLPLRDRLIVILAGPHAETTDFLRADQRVSSVFRARVDFSG
jgi:hypothetical protein